MDRAGLSSDAKGADRGRGAGARPLRPPALSESEERFRDIANAAPVMIWISDANAACTWFNKVVLDFTARPMEDHLGMGFLQFIHPADQDRVARSFLESHQSRTPVRIHFHARRHDGTWRVLDENAVARFARDGSFMGFIGSCADVTEVYELNQQLESRVTERTAALAQSEKNIRSIFETSHLYQGLMAADGTLLYANRTSLAGIGAKLDDVVGCKFWDTPWFAATPGVPGRVEAAIKSVAAGNAENVQITLALPAGTRVFDFSFRPVKDDCGKVVSIVPEAVDITERLQAEQALQQAQKMEAVGNLTGGIAHDFNNLLQGVTGSLDLIRRKADDPQRVRQWAEAGLLAADRGARLTAQLLAFSRAQKLELRPLNLALLLSGMRELLERTLGPAVRIRIAVDEKVRNVLGDETQLELAVLNLAINARDAMPDGGDLVIRARRRALPGDGELPRGDYIELAVTDTGAGMAPDVAARAFDPFFTTKEVGKGTGLGLSQVYGMARQAGGAARLSSTPGEGTTASLYLRPAAGGAAKRVARESAGKAAPEQSAHVLVVDDDPDVRRFLEESLRAMGYSATSAANGTAGLEILGCTTPDAMIVDYAMPGMTGAELSKHARALDERLPIIFASGYAETSALERAADDRTFVLRKPFRLSELQRVLSRALRR
jgi:PAS domain S-box-containing protein